MKRTQFQGDCQGPRLSINMPDRKGDTWMLPPFELENYLLRHEHKACLSFCSSGLESMPVSDLLALAGPDSLAIFDNTALDYSSPQGAEPLRQQIALQYERILPKDVCVFAGAAEGILCTLQGFLNDGDHAVVVTPCYQSLYSVPASRCEVTPVSLNADDGWQLDLDGIQASLRANTRLIVVNFPNNPTGALPSKSTMAGLVEMARKRGIYLFSDEVYRWMEIDPADRLPPMADWYERGISLSSMSKAYGMPGLRIGWIATRAPEVLSSAVEMKHYTSICPNSPAEVLGMIALRSGEKILDRNLQVMRSNLDRVDQFFIRMEDKCDWVRPRGGCLGFPRLLVPETADLLCRRLLEEEGVLVLPGSLYGRYENHFRIGFGRQEAAQGLVRLERILDGLF